jgi:adenylate cyclase
LERKLAVVVAADIVGYSRLIGADETGTLDLLRRLKAQTIGPAVAENQGRIVKFLGDGFLADFASVPAAIAASLRIQREVKEQNQELPEERRIRHRIGIHQGYIVIEDDDIYGDTVNIAARLEGLARPEEIAISEGVHDEIRDKLDIALDDLGFQQLKNIKSPVRVYCTRESHDDPHDLGEATGEISAPRRDIGGTSLGGSALDLSGKPSIAVLPFQNMSGDEEQDYFTDGVTEDLITTLAHVRSLFVIARNSTFAYKNLSPDIREVGRDLGARYVLEGSVRKAGTRIRVTAQLIDAGTGNHIWADRYDRVLEDIFELQDEISQTLAARIEPELGSAERERARRRPTNDLGAWDLYQRAMWHLYRFTPEDAGKARDLFGRAIASDENFSSAYTGLAYQRLYDVMNGYSDDFEASLADAEKNVRHALRLDEKDALARYTLGRLYTLKPDHEAALGEFERGISLNPGFAQIYHGMGFALAFSGCPSDSIPYFEKAIRLSPQDPHLTSFMSVRSYAYLILRDYEKAVESAASAIAQPNAMVWPRIFRTSALGHLDHRTAEESLADLLAYMPGLTVKRVGELLYYARGPENLHHCLDGLTSAGLPK